jgi:hypothetical protein
MEVAADQGRIRGLDVSELQVLWPTYAGIRFEGAEGLESAFFAGVDILRPGHCGVRLDGPGVARFAGVRVAGAGADLAVCKEERGFTLLREDGERGW